VRHKTRKITINGNKNIIKGHHEILFINSNGDIYEEDAHHRARTPLTPEHWVIPTNEDVFGWEIKQGYNNVVVDRGSCCGRACVYIQVDSLTI
jgi:hypothetical protein